MSRPARKTMLSSYSVFALLLVLCLWIACLPGRAWAKEESPLSHLREEGKYVYDYAGLFADSALLEEKIAVLRIKLKADLVIVTTDDAMGLSSEAFADDFYDYNDFGFDKPRGDGALLLIDMENRTVYISTCGRVIEDLSDYRIEWMLDDIAPYLSDEEYDEGALRFLEFCDDYIESYPGEAFSEGRYLYAAEGVLSDPARVEEALSGLHTETRGLFVTLIPSDMENRTSMEYAEDWLSGARGKSGAWSDAVVLLIDEEAPEAYVRAEGRFYEYLGYERRYELSQDLLEGYLGGQKEEALLTFWEKVKAYLTSAPGEDRSEGVFVYDQAGLLRTDEELNESIVSLREKIRSDIVIVTTNDNEGLSPQNYADDFYDYNDFGYDQPRGDGVLLLIDMDSRNVWISTCGRCIEAFTDARIEEVLDEVAPRLTKGRYDSACRIFVEMTKEYMEHPPGEKLSFLFRVKKSLSHHWLLYGILSLAGSGILVRLLIAKGRDKVVSAGTYIPQNGAVMTENTDQFIRERTSRTYSPVSSDDGGSRGGGGGGGSSTHTSSSGTSHGGGGRSF